MALAWIFGFDRTRRLHFTRRDYLSVTAPVAVYRYGLKSVASMRTHDPFAGVASFADFQINVTYSHEF